jgi:hypothetical protein
VKVGDLVHFHYDHRWTGDTRDWGFGLVEESRDDGMYEVIWPAQGGVSRTMGPKCLEVISEAC